ncbi:hypothetical protein PV10_08579 [Exophiala mesophila]|uniref:Rieske domain-containing protein n=1 Tax=Exophiala mesophila TaxID=212818 RepID=A0A0D1Z4W7_EXOME|nr:uncharacterized protein PV10_08579 [Exophiala mesophila]KIV88954.1 hypothetical protein PV10_08579 [Exophiala mesophila]
MTFVVVSSLTNAPLPAYLFVLSCLGYLLGGHIVRLVQAVVSTLPIKSTLVGSTLDLAEKGSLKGDDVLSDEEAFLLEKRAFFTKTWLFVCHRSRFDKPGDYLTFDIAGVSFFAVLGKDGVLRAFHNVCRHRAYTVVRKSCGSSTRFSCKYHGWQYDDTGRLVKAPKFDESPGFNPQANGLFEIKLILTRDGLIFVNFDANTMKLPFNNVKSHVDFGSCSWVHGMSVDCKANWKTIANGFSDQVHRSHTRFSWLSRLQKMPKQTRLLGPLSIVKEVNSDLWYTMIIVPISTAEVSIRCDLYSRQESKTSSGTAEKWEWMVKQEIMALTPSNGQEDSPRQSFAYECGGRTIDLLAILTQHQRSEKLAKRKLQPTIRVTGESDIDREAEAICDALDRVEEAPAIDGSLKLPKMGKMGLIDW